MHSAAAATARTRTTQPNRPGAGAIYGARPANTALPFDGLFWLSRLIGFKYGDVFSGEINGIHDVCSLAS